MLISTQLLFILIAVVVIGAIFGLVSLLTRRYSLDTIKNKTVGDGQHGTARFASHHEITRTYKKIPFTPKLWRKGKNLPTVAQQGLVLGTQKQRKVLHALVETGDVHCLMLGAAGVGKTAFFLYPNLEYACACGMSFLATDTKGDLVRNYGKIAKECYGYDVCLLDLRNPTESDAFNLLQLVNDYMDDYLANPSDIKSKAKAEKYAKIISKTIINTTGENYGQNQFFYDSAEGLLTAVILLLAEFYPPTKVNGETVDCRHIVSVFKIVQELTQPSGVKGKTLFGLLMDKLPENHKAKWFAGAALSSAEQAMMSVLSTVLSRLNAFLDSELEQILCFDSALNAEKFCNQKSAFFIVLPEEDTTKYFMVSLIIQQLYREILTIADKTKGELKNRVVFFCDELGTLPPIQSLELIFSASRSRRLSMVPIIQSFAQLEKNYGKEGAEIIVDNCQSSIFGGFAPNSKSAERLSKDMGGRTVLSGSISKGEGKASAGQSLQMIERALMTSDELKSIPKGEFIVMKTGTHPMQTKLPLFLDWGITFDLENLRDSSAPDLNAPKQAHRQVHYADRKTLEKNIVKSRLKPNPEPTPDLPPMPPLPADAPPPPNAFHTMPEFPAPPPPPSRLRAE